jgi:hypothetical protein
MLKVYARRVPCASILTCIPFPDHSTRPNNPELVGAVAAQVKAHRRIGRVDAVQNNLAGEFINAFYIDGRLQSQRHKAAQG